MTEEMKKHKHEWISKTHIYMTGKVIRSKCKVKGCNAFSVTSIPFSLEEKKKYHPEMFES